MPSRRAAAAQVERADRAARAVQLRRDGATYRDIAGALQVAVSTAHDLVAEALRALPAPDVEQMRAVEAGRMDAIHAALWPRVLQGDHQAAAVLIRASARRAALYGLDQRPTGPEESGKITVVYMHPALSPARTRPAPVVDAAPEPICSAT